MLRRVTMLLVAFAALAALPAAAASASEPGPTPGTLFLDCGETIGDEPEELVDFTLVNNLFCATGDALTVTSAADNVTVDLGGHRLVGGGGGGADGIVLNSTTGVTVTNGTLVGFDQGVELTGQTNTIAGLRLIDNGTDSIQVDGAENQLRDNTVVRGGNILLIETASATVVENNVLVDETIALSGSDSNEIRENRIFGGAVNAFAGTGAVGSGLNVIEANEIVAPTATGGIIASGDNSDNNDILGNTVTGAGSRGIDVNDADSAEVKNNIVTGSTQDGIELRGTATGADVDSNTANANTDDGFALGTGATGADLDNNTANENGDNGIEAQPTAAPVIDGTTANFNGYRNGLAADDDGLGISAPDGTTGTDNTANGNDVTTPAASQCNAAALCSAPATPAADPPVLTCGQAVGAGTTTLRHPLDCVGGNGLAIAANGVTLNLGDHRVSGGSAVITEAAVQVTGDGATITGGVLTDSGNGIRIVGGTNHGIDDALVALATGTGIAMENADESTIESTASINNTVEGISVTDGDLNVFRQLEVHGNTAGGIAFFKTGIDPNNLDDRSSKNRVTDSSLLGNGTGIQLFDSNSNLIKNNDVVGTQGNGLFIGGADNGSPKNTVEGNELLAGQAGDAAVVAGDGVAGGAGSPGNKFVSNVISANDSGVRVFDPDSTGTLIQSSTVSNNSGVGLEFEVAGAKVIKNRVDGNGSHGILFDGVAAKLADGNRVNGNGLFADVTAMPITGDDVGLGISATSGGKGCRNKGAHNDDPDQIEPAKFKKKTKKSKKCK